MRKDNMCNDEKLFKESASIAASELAVEINAPTEGIEFSKEHIEKMERLFKAERKREKVLKFSVFSKIAVCFIVIAMGSAVFYGATAWKRIGLIYDFDKKNKGTQITFLGNEPINFKSDYISFEYVPVSFTLKNNEYDEGIEKITFTNDKKYFTFSTYTEEDIDLDSISGEGKKKIKIKDSSAVLVKKNSIITIYWKDDNFSYSIRGNIERKELIKIAESAVAEDSFKE